MCCVMLIYPIGFVLTFFLSVLVHRYSGYDFTDGLAWGTLKGCFIWPIYLIVLLVVVCVYLVFSLLEIVGEFYDKP